MHLQDFSMYLYRKEQEGVNMKEQPQKTVALFIVRVSIEKGKPIEQLINDKEKQVTGLAKLSYKQLANLNASLDID